jgi:hypothetical protein
MRKRLLILASFALAAAVTVPAALLHHAYRQKLARGRLIDAEHCGRIKEGMSQAEVEAILGGPPGDFTTGAVVYSPLGAVIYSPLFADLSSSHVREEVWDGNEGEILVCFDKQGAVWFSLYQTGTMVPLSFVDRLRAWLRRVWP